jgi:hypothetical protein
MRIFHHYLNGHRDFLSPFVSVHEVIYVVHYPGEGGLVLKLDYEKAYDMVNWGFLDFMLECGGFGPILRSWIRSFLFFHENAISIAFRCIDRKEGFLYSP